MVFNNPNIEHRKQILQFRRLALKNKGITILRMTLFLVKNWFGLIPRKKRFAV